jgi:hypothetical protein
MRPAISGTRSPTLRNKAADLKAEDPGSMREAQSTSVFRDNRPTEAVVDPSGNHIDILRNVFVMVQLRNQGRIIGHANVATALNK